MLSYHLGKNARLFVNRLIPTSFSQPNYFTLLDIPTYVRTSSIYVDISANKCTGVMTVKFIIFPLSQFEIIISIDILIT